MKQKFKIGIGSFILIYGTLIILAIAAGYAAFNTNGVIAISIVISLAFCIGLCAVLFLYQIPSSIESDDESITIMFPIHHITLPKSEIAEIKPIDYSDLRGSLRLFGIGGIKFGRNDILLTGHFSNRTFGKYEMYCTSSEDLILITTAKGRKIVTNCSLHL